MRKPIIPSVVRTLRERLSLSQKELAAKAGVSKDSLSRLERGEQSGTAQRTQTDLAKALDVAPAVLTGDQEIPPLSGQEMPSKWEAPRDQWNIRVDSAVRNAFALTAIRYQIPVTRIVELAPLLFVLTAEQSLERRRSRLADLQEKLADVDVVAAEFHHLPQTLNPGYIADETIRAERQSISKHDLLAVGLSDQLYPEYELQKPDYDADEDNPFVSDLKDMVERTAATAGGIAEISSFSRDRTDFQVCGQEALDLAGGDKELAQGILSGWAPIHEMRELLGSDQLPQRILWLRQKREEHQASMRQLMIDLGIGSPSEGDGA